MQKLERKTDKQKMDKSLQGKKVAVTGAAGSKNSLYKQQTTNTTSIHEKKKIINDHT